MSLVNLVVTLIVVGVALYLVQVIPMDDAIRKIIRVIVLVIVVLWLLRVFFPASILGSYHFGT